MEENNNQKTTDFMQETIKQRPLNRRKLVRRTLITAAMAVIFGTVACLTFLVLEPLFSNRIYPQEEPKAIEFPEEIEEKEILPEDMIADDSEMAPAPTDTPALQDEQIEQVLSEMKLGAEDYISLFAGLNSVAKTVQDSIVTVIGVTSDVSWLDNQYENEGVVSGSIVADSGKELLILANISSIKGADSLTIVLVDHTEYEATIKQVDNNTGFAILAIPKASISKNTLDRAVPVSFGTSASSNLCGSPIIALGRPTGAENSICFGNITSTENDIILPDATYRMLTTDIFGSKNASGLLINLRGQVVGLIDMSHNTSDMGNLLTAMGITELKKIIERLSNDQNIAYLGVFGVDVTEEANRELGVPFGAYITEVITDSPALAAGIQSGDVITKLDGEEVTCYQDYVKVLLTKEPETELRLTIMRQGPDGYIPMDVTATVGLCPK